MNRGRASILALIFAIAALSGFIVFGPALDALITTEVHDRWEIAAVGLDEDNYYALVYKDYGNGSLDLMYIQMPKEGACLRIAVHDMWHFDEIRVFKLGLEVQRLDCLYL